MTTQAPDAVPVIQADRDAAFSYWLYRGSLKPDDYRAVKWRRELNQGDYDGKEIVRAFARHRLAALDSRAGDARNGNQSCVTVATCKICSQLPSSSLEPRLPSSSCGFVEQSADRAGDAGEGFIVKLDNWMTVSVEDDGIILRNEAGEPIAFGKLGVDAKLPATAAPEPFGYWVEQKHADPVLLRKPAYIPEPSELRTVTLLYAAPAVDAVPAGEVRLRMFLDILSAAGGTSDCSEWPGAWTNAFCETHEGQSPDTFNTAIDKGYTRSTYDADRDHGTVTLTAAGRAYLASLSHGEGRK